MVLAFLAIWLFAFAPVVKALCGLEGFHGTHAAVVAGDSASHDDGPDDDDGACCAAIDAELVESGKAFTASFAGAIEPPVVLHFAGPALAFRVSAPARSFARLTGPPPEPVSRRFPRLLI